MTARIDDPLRQWKLSPMDVKSWGRWYNYSRARDMMLEATDTDSPWHILQSDDKRRARLNCISHILTLIPYKKITRSKVKLPKRSNKGRYNDEASLQGRRSFPPNTNFAQRLTAASEFSCFDQDAKRIRSMRIETLLSTVIIPVVGLSLLSSPSHALDLSGAWAMDGKVCQKIFVRKEKGISFRPESELHGSGFIIDGNSIRGKAEKCVIKARREDGEIIHLMAACATDIMLSNVQFSLRVVNENKVSRIFPGMEGMELAYDRCSL